MSVNQLGKPTIRTSTITNTPISLVPTELDKREFLEKFKNYTSVNTDGFEYSLADEGENLSFNSRAIADCITMFGIGSNRSLFAWHSSCVEEGPDKDKTDEEIVLEELDAYFNENRIDKEIPFNIFLVGGNGYKSSEDLRSGMISAIPKFFKHGVFSGGFINPTKGGNPYKFITANFNMNGELRYYFHNEQPHNEQGYTSSDGE